MNTDIKRIIVTMLCLSLFMVLAFGSTSSSDQDTTDRVKQAASEEAGEVDDSSEKEADIESSEEETDIESSEEETDIESSEETELETIEEKVITISAVNLYRDYEANEVAADKDYKGKVVEVTGVVESISKDFLDKIYVSLKGDGYFGTVNCYFIDEYADQAADLSKGQTVTIRGECDGLAIMSVMLRGCIFVNE